MHHHSSFRINRALLGGAVALGLFIGVLGGAAHAQVLSAPYDGSYAVTDLGPVTGPNGDLGTPYGGLTFLNADTLLFGGNANSSDAAIFSVGVSRGAGGHITGFTTGPTFFATAPGLPGSGNNGIDGGLQFGPGGVLFYTSFSDNSLGEIKPGSTAPDFQEDLGVDGVNVIPSVGALGFVPSFAPGAGHLKIASFDGSTFYDAALTPNGDGTFLVPNASLRATLSGGLEGFIYVPTGSPLFGGPSMLVSEYSNGRIGAYDVDANGDPIAATRRDFITGLTGAEGAATDPVTGDFLFSTFGGGDHVIVVSGFASPGGPTAAPEPGSAFLALAGAGALALLRRKRPA